MGSLSKIRAKALPPSSKYFGQEMRELKEKLKALENENRGLHEHMERQDEMLKVISKKLDLYSVQIFRKENESNLDARIRLFSGLPEATGNLALYQATNTKLLCALANICDEFKLDYWLWSGSAVAAIGRSGKAIPWDDDIDVCMMRDDFKVLLEKLKNNKDYQVSLVYDFLSRNRQYRFVLKNPNIYNFIDIVVCDWATEATPKNDLTYKKLEVELEQEFIKHPELEYWRSFNYFFTEDSRFTYQPMTVNMDEFDQKRANKLIEIIDPIFEEYLAKAKKKKLLCDKSDAKAVAYGLDNLFNAPKRQDIWNRDIIFPTHKVKYEDLQVKVPHREYDFCDICFPGWPYIPNDICGHSHIPEEVINSPECIEAMRKFIS